jgi:C-terminal processing protease CtpA/Prc
MLRAVLFLILCPAVAFAEAEPHEWFFEQPFMPQRGRIGIHVQSMTPELRDYFGVSSDRGVLVTLVEQGRPAERAAVRVGDVITDVNEEPVHRPFDLIRVLARVPRDGDATLTVVRDRQEQTIRVAVEGDPTPWIDPDYWREWLRDGMREGSRELRQRLDELQRRLEELEKKFEEEQKSHEGHGEAT